MVDYTVYIYIEVVMYIYISKICCCVLRVKILDLCCEVTVENNIFVSLLVCSPKVMFL